MAGKVAEKFRVMEKIGEGGFGVVYKCRDRVTKEIVAVKKMYILEQFEGVPSTVIREISLLKELDHSNIVRLLDVINSGNKVFLVFEYLHLDLHKFIINHPNALKDPHLIKSFLHQILCGVHYCHSHKIIHRDLKPENLLIDTRRKILKVADFGLARAVGVPPRIHTAGGGTLAYRAPEILLGLTKYSTPVDVWAVGCIFAEMVNQKPLFPGMSEIDVLYEVLRVLGVPNEETWPGLTSECGFYLNLPMFQIAPSAREELADVVKGLEPDGFDLLSKMLCLNPNARITASDALKHPYFKDFQNAP